MDREQRPELTGDQPRLIEYDWVHPTRPEKQVPIAIIDALLAELREEEDDEPTA